MPHKYPYQLPPHRNFPVHSFVFWTLHAVLLWTLPNDDPSNILRVFVGAAWVIPLLVSLVCWTTAGIR